MSDIMERLNEAWISGEGGTLADIFDAKQEIESLRLQLEAATWVGICLPTHTEYRGNKA